MIINNKGALPSAAVLLAWMHMGDHEHHNQYMRRLQREDPEGDPVDLNEYYLIDLSDVHGLGDWSRTLFGFPKKPYSLPRHLCERVPMEDAEEVVDKILLLDEGEIASCLDHYPDEWGIDEEAIGRLTEFLLRRRRHLMDILKPNLSIFS